MKRTTTILGVLTSLVLGASVAQAFDPNWKKSDCDLYSEHGLGERYVYGGDKGWIDNGVWDSSSTEGVDCSSYVSRCWAIDGPSQTWIGEHTTGTHPYGTVHFYPGNVPNTAAVSQSDLQSWDCWVYRSDYDPDAPGEHMGLVKSASASNIVTREARSRDYGVVEVTRSKSTLASWGARYYRRANWEGAAAQMTKPLNGSRFTSSTVSFAWNAGRGVSGYYLWIGSSVGARNMYSSDQGMSLSRTLRGFPTDGRKIYVRLWSYINDEWHYNDYAYRASTQ